MRLSERLKNLLLGGSILFWTVREIWGNSSSLTSVSWAVFALNVVVGTLFVLRTAARAESSVGAWLGAFPCVLWGALVFHWAPPASRWPEWAVTPFLLATCWTGISLIVLGPRFSVFPAWRGLVAWGPYRLVRHPAYLGECLMAVSGMLLLPLWIFSFLIPVMLWFVIWRIRVEEQLLSQQPEYQTYQQQVRWRLLPGIW